MNQDSNQDHEAEIWMVENAARKLLVKLMALVEIHKLADYNPELVYHLYKTYAQFRTIAESTYGPYNTQ